MGYDLFHGDCLKVLSEMKDNSIDSIVTDPPYGLSFMGKKWDYDVPSVEIWREALRVLKPGGYLLSFAGSRTYHRMAVNIEDAGFEIRDQIMWVYGSGFPKSHNISKAIDKAAGAEREVIGERITGTIGRPTSDGTKPSSSNPNHGVGQQIIPITAPTTPKAKQWDGWGTALKPAHEPIVVARKPLIGTVVENVLEHGTGGLNIDACRVEYDKESFERNKNASEKEPKQHEKAVWKDSGNKERRDVFSSKGRFPANFIHDGSDEVVSLFPESARFFYCAKAHKSEKGEGNIHPTVKPVDLMRYLCRLVTPPNGVILDPFMGSGTTGIAASVEAFNFIGIEREEEYIEIAKNRISHWDDEEEEKRREESNQTNIFEWG
tara:strand:- start:3873 stop:5003 length:1131 start_codon:yes stop_codon:yes gene_type:complete